MPLEALHWICGLLRSRDIPFQVCGGLAAVAYGSSRPLNDIDLFVPGERFQEVVAAGGEFISKPAKRYREGEWDLEYVQFIYSSTKIEVGNAFEARIFDSRTKRWTGLGLDFSSSKSVELWGMQVPVMARTHLVHYKHMLNRAVDRQDIEAITSKTETP